MKAPTIKQNGYEPASDSPEWLKLVCKYVSQLEYGQVQITIHQGKVIQVESTQRTRLQPSN